MSTSELKGKIQTVLGLIEPEELGVTLPHEHLISDGSAWYREPEEACDLGMARSKVSIETLWWIRLWPQWRPKSRPRPI
jgi:phosphotriesterase-related protein